MKLNHERNGARDDNLKRKPQTLVTGVINDQKKPGTELLRGRRLVQCVRQRQATEPRGLADASVGQRDAVRYT